MPAHAHRMSSILESLEPRLLLAAFELGWDVPLIEPAGTGNNGAGDPGYLIERQKGPGPFSGH